VKQVFRVGIAGGGFGARVHAPLMRAHGGFEPVAVASLNGGDLEGIRRTSGVEAVVDGYPALLELDLDLVVVASHPGLHRPLTEAALQRGVHVLCEKPMAIDAEEAEAMEALRSALGLVGAITFEFRFRPARQAVRRLIAEGRLGRLLHIAYTGREPRYRALAAEPLGWLARRAQGGGRLGALGSHMFDSLRFWTGDEPAELQAQLATHVPQGPKGERRDADDGFQIVGRMRSGATFMFDYLSASHQPSGWHLEVHGSEGLLRMEDDQVVGFLPAGGAWQEIPLPKAASAGLSGSAASYESAMLPFLDRLHLALVHGEAPGDLPVFQDGAQVQRLLDAARRSSETGRREQV